MNESPTERKHRFMVQDLKKSPIEITGNLMEDDAVDMIHAALGLAGESGEVVDMIKKAVINGNPGTDFRVKLALEIGDVMFYIQMLLMSQNLTMEEVLAANITKLRKRYPEGYSDQASIARVDV